MRDTTGQATLLACWAEPMRGVSICKWLMQAYIGDVQKELSANLFLLPSGVRILRKFS